ncbi:DUF305 domain-containing protein [Brunnivagina elsteri]|uniref:DUF305 domain-containing protein n=1 Tax=Brunnivagina elsteri CCALA 953 TaxID=987040 RepID=A0A2A2TLL6_9CYAN|nr:DUF305 domain-containing protein [Calothrix elsteri]PAX58446.1 DUF305 domain-containing protein [Calothrix elsteri CCALA 953]
MKLPLLKTTSLAFAIALTTATGSSLLTGCSGASKGDKQAQAPTNTTEVSNKQHGGINHNGMNHNMDLGPADANYDLRFIDGMIPHHEGAVVMAKEALQKSKRPEIKKLANDIIKAQDKEISELKQWRKAWYAKAPSEPQAWHAQMNHMMAMSPEVSQAMRMDMDLGTADAEFDLRFINAMVPHHEGAVIMGQDALNKSKRPEIKKLAIAIISSQKAEIKQMQQWRQDWYKK